MSTSAPNPEFQLSIYDQMRKNRWRTLYLFIAFPIIILGLSSIGIGIAYGHLNFYDRDTQTILLSITIGVIIWSIISYFIGSRMILAFAGAKPIAKSDAPELYRAVENASIAAGLPKTPDIYIIEDHSLNAFATGHSLKTSKVAISRGLLEKLEKAELEAVMSHEIGHILNKDIRVMLISIAIVGAIQMVGEVLIRSRSRSSRSKGNFLPLIGLLFLTIGVILGTLTRLAISREREYLADSTGAHLTSNPKALASALEKIAQDARLEVLDQKASLSGLCIADPTASGHFGHSMELKNQQAQGTNAQAERESGSFWQRIWSSHPPILDRIKRLRGY